MSSSSSSPPSLLSLIPFSDDDLSGLFALEESFNNRSIAPRDRTIIIPTKSIIESKLHSLLLLTQSSGTEAEWQELIIDNHSALIHSITLSFAYLPISSDACHDALSLLLLFASLNTKSVVTVVCTHSAFNEKLCGSIDPFIPLQQLHTRLHLLYLLLVYSYPSTPQPKFEVSDDTLNDTLTCLLIALSHPLRDIFAMSTYNLLLLDRLKPHQINGKNALSNLLSIISQPEMIKELPQLPNATTTSFEDTLLLFQTELLKVVNQGVLEVNAVTLPEEESLNNSSDISADKRALDWGEELIEEEVKGRRRKFSREERDRKLIERLQHQESITQRASSQPCLLAALSFIASLFQCHHYEFFYTNDMFVLADILLNLLEDSSTEYSVGETERLNLRSLLLSCYFGLVEWEGYDLYKKDEVIACMSRILSSEENELRGDEDEENIHIQRWKISAEILNKLQQPDK